MADTLPPSGDRTVVIHRHGVLTWISLGFNALILLLILIGIVCHHHQRQHEHGGWSRHHERQDWGGRGHDHGNFDRHDFGAMHRDGDRRDGGARDDDRGASGDRGGSDMGDHHGWGDGGPDFGHSKGPENFKPMTPPSAESMTDRFMLAMTDKLKLTDQESSQIRPIVQDQITQFQKDMEAQKAAHQKMIDDAKAKIRPILTPDQQKQFDQLTAGLGGPTVAPAETPASK
jgi:hypothetical protein